MTFPAETGPADAATAKVEVVEVLSRYHHILDQRAFERLDEVLTPDAEVSYPGMVEKFGFSSDHVRGRDAIRAWLEASLVDALTVHYMTNHVFESLSPDTARVRSSLLSFIVTHDLATVSAPTTGFYETTLRRSADGWRIDRLSVVHNYLSDTIEMVRRLSEPTEATHE